MIPFTQYVLPNGRAKETGIERSPEIEAEAQRIIAQGNRFEAEILSTGQVSLTITNDDDGDLEIAVVPNGPGVGDAVDAMIRRFLASAGAAAVALCLFSGPADATTIIDKGDIIRGELNGANQPMLWDSLEIHRWKPIWLDWMKTRKQPGAICLSDENSTGRNGMWYDRDGDCVQTAAVTPPVVVPPAVPPVLPPAQPPVVPPLVPTDPGTQPPSPVTPIPLPASLVMLLAALGGLGLLRRRS